MLVAPQKRDHLRAGCCALLAIFPGGEQFPVETRTVGVALAFSISPMIFGGFAPFIATWLIAQTGDPLSAGLLPDGDGAAQHHCAHGIERRGRLIP
jgi:hypothetical protein